MYAANQQTTSSPMSWDHNRVVFSGGTTMDVERAARTAAAHRRSNALGAWVGGLIGRLRTFLRQRRTVRELRALDDRTLADLGISRSDIKAIASGVYVAQDATYGYRVATMNSPVNDQNSRHVAG
jgi:uncharacterized protein YjiS (DUF1127 family)